MVTCEEHTHLFDGGVAMSFPFVAASRGNPIAAHELRKILREITREARARVGF